MSDKTGKAMSCVMYTVLALVILMGVASFFSGSDDNSSSNSNQSSSQSSSW